VGAFIKYVTFDCADPWRLAGFWSTVTGYQCVMESDDLVALAAPDKRGVRGILFWRVPEPKRTKNRMHVDLAAQDPEEEIARLISLGAQKVDDREGNGASWAVMLDPEGNEFCLG
jgi:predicted enzyme related to lactoylglutathione lyase